MDQVQPWQLLTAFGVVILIGSMILIWGDRPELAAAIRRHFEERPRHILSSDDGTEEDDDSASIGADDAVPGQQHQPALELVPTFQTVIDYLIVHNLTDEQAIDLFALARRESGDHYLSANKIRETVGGNEAEVKRRVAARRPKPPVARASPSIRRPANGW